MRDSSALTHLESFFALLDLAHVLLSESTQFLPQADLLGLLAFVALNELF